MNPTFRAGVLSGFVAGGASVGIALMILTSRPAPAEPPPKPAAPVPAKDPLSELEEANRELLKQLAEERSKRRESAPAPKAEKPADEAPLDLKERFAKLAEAGLAAFQSPDYAKMLEAIKADGKHAVEFLAGVLRNSSSATERFLAAALLEGAADPSAIPALAEALKGDKDLIVRRMASHALAVLGSDSAQDPLRSASTGDADWGVRVNSAYGLAKLKQDDGLRMLTQAYESSETPAEYRLAILYGLADVAAPASAPLFRRILTDTKDAAYLLPVIKALETMKDAGALAVLERLASADSSDLVKQAASKAIEAIRK
jgi:hypothetical protein